MRLAPLLAAAAFLCADAVAACPPAGTSRAELLALKADKWQVADDARRRAMAVGMLDCLADPDPVLRDELGFEALSAWIRGEKLDLPTLQALRAGLLPMLAAPDPQGFARPFAALALAEVARADRRKPYLDAAQRKELVAAAGAYLSGVRDYRGFDERQGRRHGVAHGADLMLQLALNPALERADHDAILAAIASQVLAHGAHFYIYGEGERLMAPVFYLARRDTMSGADWDAWLARVLAGYRRGQPATQGLLAQRHNLNAFLLPLHAALQQGADRAQRERLLPALTSALKRLD